MTRALRVRQESWPLARTFAIARGRKSSADVVVAEIEADGITGRGECVPYARYGETIEGVVARIEGQRDAIAAGLDRHALQSRLLAGAARNALDCALWDLEAKASGKHVWEIAGLAPPAPTTTAETIGIDLPEAMAEAAALLAGRPLLKVKLDHEDIVERIKAVRTAAPKARLIVDANEAWDLCLLKAVSPPLAALGVEMIEQPLPSASDAVLADYRGPVALCADESMHTARDIAGLLDRYQMVNIKLDKTGGLTEAMRAVATAGAAGIDLMVGCMVCTSLAIAPALLLAASARVADLDGPLWLAQDRAYALNYRDGVVSPPQTALWG